MSVSCYLICQRCRSAINIGQYVSPGPKIVDKHGLPEYNRFEPDWKSTLAFTPPDTLLAVRAFLLKHFKCKLEVSLDTRDLPWESGEGWSVTEP